MYKIILYLLFMQKALMKIMNGPMIRQKHPQINKILMKNFEKINGRQRSFLKESSTFLSAYVTFGSSSYMKNPTDVGKNFKLKKN